MAKRIIYLLLAIAVFGCDKSANSLPEELKGNWSNTIQIEGTEGVVENQISIADDTIILKQSFPRMSGIDKIKSTYGANRIEADNNGVYSFYTTTENMKSRIILELVSSAQLKISICQLNSGENKDAEFTSCTELGLFGR